MSSIEEIVIDIQKGIDRKNELYLLIENYVRKLCLKYYPCAKDIGYEFDDLVSCSWLGIEKAIMDFTPEKGYKFITYLKYHTRNSIAEFLGFRGAKHLDTISLDTPIDDTEGLTLGDTVRDEASDEAFNKIEFDVIGESFWKDIEKLSEQEKAVLVGCYKLNKSYGVIAENLGVSNERVRQIKQKALRKLRKSPRIREYGAEYFAYRHTTLKAFNTTGTSSTEWAVLKTLTVEEQSRKVVLSSREARENIKRSGRERGDAD